MTMISCHFLIGVLSFSDIGPSKGLHGKVVSHPPLLEIATVGLPHLAGGLPHII